MEGEEVDGRDYSTWEEGEDTGEWDDYKEGEGEDDYKEGEDEAEEHDSSFNDIAAIKANGDTTSTAADAEAIGEVNENVNINDLEGEKNNVSSRGTTKNSSSSSGLLDSTYNKKVDVDSLNAEEQNELLGLATSKGVELKAEPWERKVKTALGYYEDGLYSDPCYDLKLIHI